MPDLTHRPSRYATVIVAILALGVAGYANADVSVGGQAALVQQKEANASLRAERDALKVELERAAVPTCDSYPTQDAAQAVFDATPGTYPGWDGDKDGMACEQLDAGSAAAGEGATETCSAFGSQEDAQKVFAADPAAHVAWDGDSDGIACEQLRSAAPATATPAVVPAGSAQTCSAFGSQEAAQKVFDANRAAHPTWDGDNDGLACEQLRSAKAPAAAPATPAPVAAETPPNGSTTPPPSEVPPVTQAPITAFSKAEIVGSKDHFGLYAATAEEYQGLEATLARDSTIHGYFQGFDTDFRPEAVKSAWQGGEIPMLTWESRPLNSVTDEAPYSLANIVDGSWDAYLTKYAQDITATGLPLIIRFDHEMNGTWYRWSESNPDFGNAPGSYIAAWQHIHDIFEANGANQFAIWNWAPNRVNNSSGWLTIDHFYPGDAYVDWVGMTGYLRTASDTPTFRSVFNKSLAEIRAVAPGKPILLAETGATENGGHKLAYLQDFFANITANPDVIGFVWFNYAVSEDGATNDWRITSTQAVTDAFRAGLYSSEFGREQGRAPYLVPAAP